MKRRCRSGIRSSSSRATLLWSCWDWIKARARSWELKRFSLMAQSLLTHTRGSLSSLPVLTAPNHSFQSLSHTLLRILSFLALSPLPAPCTGGNSVGGSLVTGGCLANYLPGAEERRKWVFPLYSYPGPTVHWLTISSAPGKHPIHVQTNSYIWTMGVIKARLESWSEITIFPTEDKKTHPAQCISEQDKLANSSTLRLYISRIQINYFYFKCWYTGHQGYKEWTT